MTQMISHIISNHSLTCIHFIVKSSDAFITFVKKMYDMLEYEYDIEEIVYPDASLHFTPKGPNGWDHFCDNFVHEIGTHVLPYTTCKERINEYRTLFLEYITGYLLFDKTKALVKEAYCPSSLPTTEKKKEDVSSTPDLSTYLEEELKKDSPTDYHPYSSSGTEHFYHFEQDWKKTSGIDPSIRTIILFDELQHVTYVIQGADCEWVSEWRKIETSTTILMEYASLLCEKSKGVRDYFQLRAFIDKEDANEMIKGYDSMNRLSKQPTETENSIKGYLLNNYEISGDPQKMIKASVLQERISHGLMLSPIGNTPMLEESMTDVIAFRKTLSSVLLDSGLKKKRLRDGIYYYGIHPISAREKEMDDIVDKMIQERNHKPPPSFYY